MKPVIQLNSDSKDLLEGLETYILSTSELINERLEEVHR
jgi:hypothetical protein